MELIVAAADAGVAIRDGFLFPGRAVLAVLEPPPVAVADGDRLRDAGLGLADQFNVVGALFGAAIELGLRGVGGRRAHVRA